MRWESDAAMFIAANRFLLLVLMWLTLVLSGSAFAVDLKTPAYLFDDWAKGESENEEMRVFATWKSPSGNFAIEFLKSGEDVDVFTLIGKSLTDGQEVVLARGTYSVDIKWIRMNAGEVAVVDHGISNGLNELFVLKPTGAKGWDLIYKTPNRWAPDGLAVDHCYWSVVGVDKDLGSLRLRASWTYSNVSNSAKKKMSTEGTYNIPLFFGFHTAKSE